MLLKPLLFCLLVFTFSSIQAVPTRNQSDDFDLAVKAIKERNLAELKMLLEKDRNLIDKADDKFGATLLHWAAVARDVNIIKLLLEYHPRLGAQNKENATPLMLALVPNPNAEPDAKSNNNEVVNLLFEKATCELRNSEDKTALHLAAEYGDEDVVLTLLGLGSNPIAKSPTTKEPWYYATNVKIKKILKEKAAERTAENYKSALHEYAETGNLAELKSLLQLAGNRINLNSTNAAGETPLIVAARKSHYEIVAFLIKMNADFNVPDAKGLKVWDYLCAKKGN
ncbi:MAG TPA: ankyrin repeat domain-containing protein [Pyrinomonadaceae bacterium]|nr:ankyrin repeat domain-containing protein [Pyrinomonadaceae bacterium]